MIKPRALKPGDTIAVVAPASPAAQEQYQAGLDLLRKRGYNVLVGECLVPRENQRWHDSARAEELQRAWFDPNVKAVLCARGGYGCARLFPYLNLEEMAKQPKLFVGFSDITILHLAFNRLGLVTLYAPMPITFSKPREPWVLQMWWDVLEGRSPQIPPEAPKPITITPGFAEGETVGGCLCLICDSLATPYAIDSRGKILLIEDVDEPPHRVDAMLTHLRHAGVLQQSAGIVIGEMTRTDEIRDPESLMPPWKEIVFERIHDLGIPAVMGFPFGHCEQMCSLFLGVRAQLDADTGSLQFLEEGVKTE
ncbi:MAG: LD-carboxypeptidase [Fimbriimonadales bacterium]|nr:LD-carboxypeptidase [Fimbriimonadales bacterium]